VAQRRRIGRLLAARGLLSLLVVAGLPTMLLADVPAGAHQIGQLAPSNYRTRITAVVPPTAGLTVSVVDAGDQLALTNATRRDIVVLGYRGEPYLRVGPGGAFENARSPSTYRNRTRLGTGRVPAHADPGARPLWRKAGHGPTVSWHEHRAQWMEIDDPPQVRAQPWQPHVIIPRWELALLDGDRRIRVVGDLTWIPTPVPRAAPGPRWELRAGLAVLTLVATWALWVHRRRWTRAGRPGPRRAPD